MCYIKMLKNVKKFVYIKKKTYLSAQKWRNPKSQNRVGETF